MLYGPFGSSFDIAGAGSRMRRSLESALCLAAAFVMPPLPLAAHPHVFIDGGLDFVFDSEGRLKQLRVTWIYDPLTSLFMLEDLDIDPGAAGVLPDADRGRLAAYQTEWYPEFQGDSYLWDGDRRIGLSGPVSPDAEVAGGKVVIRFLRDVDIPFRPGRDTVAKIYDPTYFTAYFVTETPRLEGSAAGCSAEVVRFSPDGPLAALQQDLLSVPADSAPKQKDVGALFAEKVFVRCD